MAGGGKGSATYKASQRTRNKNTARGADAGYMRQQQRAERAMAHAERGGKMGATAKGQVAAASKALRRDAGVQKGGALRAAAPKSSAAFRGKSDRPASSYDAQMGKVVSGRAKTASAAAKEDRSSRNHRAARDEHQRAADFHEKIGGWKAAASHRASAERHARAANKAG